MSDLDDVRKRMQKRRGTNKKPLNDDNFKRFYNFMVKFMVVILVVLVSMSYIKINPDSNIKKMILNDTNYKAVTSWISDNLFSFCQVMMLVFLVAWSISMLKMTIIKIIVMRY